jgi:hypothetical protein
MTHPSHRELRCGLSHALTTAARIAASEFALEARLTTLLRSSTVAKIRKEILDFFVDHAMPKKQRVTLPRSPARIASKSQWPDLRPLAADRGCRRDRGLGMLRMTRP